MTNQSLVDQNAELDALCSILRDPDALTDCPHISPDHFIVPIHNQVFKAVLELKNLGKPCNDAVLIAEHIGDDNVHNFLWEANSRAVQPGRFKLYADIVVDKALRREIMKLSSDLNKFATEPDSAVDGLIEIQRLIEGMNDNFAPAPGLSTHDHLMQFVERMKERASGKNEEVVPFHIKWLDSILFVCRKHLHVMAALPGAGKTSMMLTMAAAQIKAGLRVAIFVSESPSSEILDRLISVHSGIPFKNIFTGYSYGDDYQREQLMEKHKELLLNSKNFIIHGKGDFTNDVDDIRMKLRKFEKESGRIDAVYVDYLQRLDGPRHMRSHNDRIGELGYNIKALSQLSATFDCAMNVLCQFNRSAAESDRPGLHHLKGSSDIDQEANIVTILHRKKEMIEEAKKAQTEVFPVMFYSDKFRLGAKDDIDIMFQGPIMKFTGVWTGMDDRQYLKRGDDYGPV